MGDDYEFKFYIE